MKKINLSGQKIGRWLVGDCVERSKDGQKIYECVCECGTKRLIRSGNLRSGHSKSCGCMAAERLIERNKLSSKHGGCGTRLYRIWLDMRNRCSNDKAINWNLYGGRGIKVCKEWECDFVPFQEWALSHGYSDELQLDRINNDGDYEPNNCKWSTISEQGNNRRTCVYITINGERKTLTEWCNITKINRNTAYSRIRYGWDPVRAVTEEVEA